MARQTSRVDSGGMFSAERGLAWVFGLGALLMGVIGLLRGFGWIGPQGVDVTGVEIEGLQTAAVQGDFWDAMVWKVPAVALGVLALTMARAAHRHDGGGAMWAHWGAYLMALLTLGAVALALLVGFDLLGMGTTQTDGVIWGVAAIIYGAISAAFHAAVPAAVADEDYLVHLVESRVGTTRMTAAGTAPEMERGR
jgi:hypothetical protein